MLQPYPLKFNPILKTVLWGGTKIRAVKHIESKSDNVGESWELSGVPGSVSVISNGLYKGWTIQELLDKYGDAVLGQKIHKKFGSIFPILIKFIDAAKNLSIQVHPNDEMAGRLHHCLGKTELWYVVDSENNASLYSGFSRKTDRNEFLQKIKQNQVVELLNNFQTRRGDIYYLPAGRVHSIGAGNFLLEIQQTSDITYRVYDYDRIDKDGKKRELHTELAQEAIDFGVYDDYKKHIELSGEEASGLIKKCSTFTSYIYRLTHQTLHLPVKSANSFMIVICVAGSVKIEDTDGNREDLCVCETALIPCQTEAINIIPKEAASEVITVQVDL